jgi:acyl carrier protein
MTVDEGIRQKVIEVLSEEFELDPDRLIPEATLYNDLGLDSLDAVDLVVALEKAFSFKLTDEAAVRAVRTVDDLFRLIEKTRTWA